VHFAANAMSGVITDYAVTVFLSVFLDDRSDVAHAFVWPALSDAKLETLFRDPNELLEFVAHISNRNCDRRIADKSVQSARHIK